MNVLMNILNIYFINYIIIKKDVKYIKEDNMFFKYLEAYDKEFEITLILKINPDKELDIYINNEEIEKGMQSIAKLKSINSIFNEIIECKTRITIENFIIVPINKVNGI
jgi:hypothetical protein